MAELAAQVEQLVDLVANALVLDEVERKKAEEAADELVAKLREAKYPAFREPARIGGRTLHRVRIGPEADRRLAEAMAAGLSSFAPPASARNSRRRENHAPSGAW